MISIQEFYEVASTIFDNKTFILNDEERKISIKLPLNWEQINNFKKTILSLFGNPHTPDRKWEDDPAHWGYKFDAHYFDIDEDTIKIDDRGRLYVDLNTFTNLEPIKEKVIENILNDDETLNKIAAKILSKLTVDIPEIPTKPKIHPICCDEDDDGEGFIHCP
jgi:hypothetical protein